ncbi:hypothetical protein DL95DRAFT_385888 [Leptodontidium sp. 2 PMI_412]|nr:hypothetical protein DL95DRAFT_385888 [Leptodontidium sp. 2 PMI_412]
MWLCPSSSYVFDLESLFYIAVVFALLLFTVQRSVIRDIPITPRISSSALLAFKCEHRRLFEQGNFKEKQAK